MANLSAFEACTWFVGVYLWAVSAARYLDFNLVPHEPTFMVFCNTFFSGFSRFKFHEAITNFKLDRRYPPYFAEAALQV